MKIAIVGGREFKDYDLMRQVFLDLVQLVDSHSYQIVSGGARGADTLAKKLAEEFNLGFIEFKPITSEINLYGFGRAAYMRNQRIVDEADCLLAFPDPNSRGTWDSVRKAQKRGIPVTIIEDEEYKEWKSL